LAASLNDHRFSNEPLVRRAINANLRVGKPENMQNLLKYIQFVLGLLGLNSTKGANKMFLVFQIFFG
jgi:hypothetical protein